MQKFPSENIGAFPKPQPSELKQKKQQTYEECFFHIEDLNQVIKVPECLYANDNQKVAGIFFVCSCMDDNSPICEGCALKCHVGHTMYELQGSHMCTCGKMNHLVKDISKQNKEGGYPCFYSKFYEITPNKGFDIKDNNKYCSICAAYCNCALPVVGLNNSLTQEMISMSYLSKSAECPKLLQQDKEQDNVVDEYSYSNLENKQQCTCMDNHMNNVVRLNGDLTRKIGFHTHMRNFNVNILFKIQKTKQLYVKSLTEQIKSYINRKATNQMSEFPGNYLTTSILEMFSNFAANWKNKYVSIVSFLYEFQFTDLLNLMTIPQENHVPESQTPENFFNGKLYFAELLFNYYIKSHVLRYNNLFSMKTILNMSLGQRVNFLHHAKEFYKYIYIRDGDGDNISAETAITKLASAIIELYATIIKMSSQLEWKVLNKSFTTFNRIMKFLLKYNLINDNEKKKYFDIVLDALHLFYRDKKQALVGTSLHLIKCVLYSGIYINDRKCISYITNTKHHGEKFVFQIDDLNIKICKIFLIVFPFINCWFKEDETPQMRFGSAGWYYMKETFLEKNLIYDYCMKKFFSFLIVKNDFYLPTIARLDVEDKQIIEDYYNHVNDYHEYYFNERLRNVKFYNVLSALSEELGTETKHYIQYEISLEIFVRRVAVLYSNFETYLEKQKKQDILDKLNEKIRANAQNQYNSGSNSEYYNSRDDTVDTTRDKQGTIRYHHQVELNENNIIDNFKTTDYPKIKKEVSKLFKQDLKQSIMITNFIQKIDEFFYIYSKGLEFKDQDYNTSGGKSDLRTIINFIMKLYTSLIKNDLKMLILITNTKPEIFVPTCLLGDTDLFFKLLNRVCDLLVEHKNDLSEDCFYFYIGCIRQMLFLQGENIQLLPQILRLACKCVRVVMQKDTNYCSLIEMFSELFGKLKSIPSIAGFFKSNTTHHAPSSSIIEFFESYFIFLSELMNNDLYLFDLVKNEIASLDEVEKCVFKFLNTKTNCESPEFEYALFRYYFLKKLSLGITKKDINYQMRNLFDRDINPEYEINLFKLIINPNDGVNATKMKLQEVLNTIKVLRQVMKRFVCETFNNFILNYYEHIFLRPLNVLMHHFVMFSNNGITGADCYVVYETLFLFYEITLKIFGGERCNYGYNEICVKSELTVDDIRIICEEKMKLSVDNVSNENAIRYFELKKLYESFMKVSECVLHVVKHDVKGDNDVSGKEGNNDNGVNEDKRTEDDNSNSGSSSNVIMEKYVRKKTKYYDSSLVFIKTLSLLATETGIDSRPYIIKYFVHKLFNPLNENYLYPSSLKNIIDDKIKSHFKMFTPYTRNRFNQSDNIEISNGKFQNIYSLMILNELFFHDSLNFQNGFTSFFERKTDDLIPTTTTTTTTTASRRRSVTHIRDDKANFLTFITKNVILTCLLAAVSKRYEIDYISDNANVIGRNMDYAYQVAKYAIKFIQSLCEGHNREYQSYFFEAFFMNSNGNYLLCNFKKDVKLRLSKANTFTDNNDSSFLNFLFFLMQIITDAVYPENEFRRDVFEHLKHKDYQNLLELYTSITDLIVEMLQGTYYKNFTYLYKEVSNDYSGVLRNPTDTQSSPTKKHNVTSTKNVNEVQKRMYFQFIVNAVKTSEMIIMNNSHLPFSAIKSNDSALPSITALNKYKFKKELFNPLSYEMKLRQFLIINTVISQDKIPKNIIIQLNAIFPAESLIEVISLLLCKIYQEHINDNPSESLNNSKLYELKRSFEKNLNIYNDDYFQLASQMYLFLTIMAETYNMKEPQVVINQKNESVVEIDDTINKQMILNEDGYELMSDNVVDTDANIQEEKIAKIKTKNNIIVACKFFSDIIKKVEFKILQDDNTLNLKTIYFIIDPAYYEISPNSIKKFQNEVDRSTGTTKIRALIDNLEIFLAEVEQAEKNQKGIKINFQDCILYNFICSCFVNMMLLFFLSDTGGASQIFLKVFTYFIQIAQVAVNIFLVFVFLFTKYDFFTEMEKKKYDKKKRTLWNIIHIYIIDSFISNDEIYLINFLIVTGILGLFTKYNLFFFVVQMLTVVNFVDTIQEIIKAFYIRIDQLFCMIGFLAILIFFYANVGFYFYVEQFNTVISGMNENFCQSLLECAITYFNHGVRAGGGIGDVLGEQGFDNVSAYYLRWITDMVFYITVILLLLNMINGVIVSTFSQIREMSQQKEDDINNKCFICNIERKIFEKKKKDFLKHQEEEHNLTHYIMFFIYVLRISEKDLDADQTFIVDCLNNKDNRCFPLKMTRSIGVVEDEGEEEED